MPGQNQLASPFYSEGHSNSGLAPIVPGGETPQEPAAGTAALQLRSPVAEKVNPLIFRSGGAPACFPVAKGCLKGFPILLIAEERGGGD